MRIFTIIISLLLISNINLAQPCVEGFSGGYPCQNIDQLGFLAVEDIGGGEMNDVWGWTSPVSGREFAIACRTTGTAFIDITVPENPIYLGNLTTHTFESIWRDVKVYGNFAFIVADGAGEHGIQVFDLSQLDHLELSEIPVWFEETAHYSGFHNAHNIAINEETGFAYAIGTNTFAGGLHVVNIQDPVNPVFAGSFEEDGYTHDCQVVNYHGPDMDYPNREIAFAANEDALTIVDVTNKTDINMISTISYDLVAYAHQGWLTDDHKYFISNDELDEQSFGMNTRTLIWDVQNLDMPELIGEYFGPVASIDHNLYVKGNAVYASNYTSGLRILDLTEVTSGELTETAFFDVTPGSDEATFNGSWSNYPFFESEVIPVTNIEEGLHLLKPKLLALESEIVENCEGSITIPITINHGFFGDLTLSLAPGSEYPEDYSFSSTTATSPGNVTANFTNAAGEAPYYYSGAVVLSNADTSLSLPYYLITGDQSEEAATLNYPEEAQFLPNQQVNFEFSQQTGVFWHLEVATDVEFNNIVGDVYGDSPEDAEIYMPFTETAYFWRVSILNSCAEDVLSEVGSFTITSATGVTENELAEIKIYPNPTKENLTISSEQLITDFQIFDLAGRMVKSETVVNSQRSVNVNISELNSGMYILSVNRKAGNHRFVIL